MPDYNVSRDGKTVTVSGKTYSLAAFKKQFKTEPGVPLTSGSKGYAYPDKNAPKTIKVTSSSGPEKPQSKAQQKANKKAIKELNKRKFGQMLTEKENAKTRPTPPKPATGRTRIGGLGTGRGGMSIGGGLFGNRPR